MADNTPAAYRNPPPPPPPRALDPPPSPRSSTPTQAGAQTASPRLYMNLSILTSLVDTPSPTIWRLLVLILYNW